MCSYTSLSNILGDPNMDSNDHFIQDESLSFHLGLSSIALLICACLGMVINEALEYTYRNPIYLVSFCLLVTSAFLMVLNIALQPVVNFNTLSSSYSSVGKPPAKLIV